MAKFSIKETVVYGFNAYAQNLVLMLCVGATIGLATWGTNGVPALVAKQLGVKANVQSTGKKGPAHPAIPHASMYPEKTPKVHSSKMAAIHHHLREAGKKIHAVVAEKAHTYVDHNPTHLLMLFLVWAVMALLYLFIHIGVIRIALDVVDNKKTSYERVFSQRALIVPYVGLTVVYMFLIVCIAFGAIIAGVVLGGLLGMPLGLLLGKTGAAIGFGVGIVSGLAVLYKFIMRYVFAFYCLIDKKMGIHKALTCTYELTKGSVLKLILLLVVISLPFAFGGAANVHMRIGKEVFNNSVHAGIIAKTLLGLVTPLYALCLAHVYRKLGRG